MEMTLGCNYHERSRMQKLRRCSALLVAPGFTITSDYIEYSYGVTLGPAAKDPTLPRKGNQTQPLPCCCGDPNRDQGLQQQHIV